MRPRSPPTALWQAKSYARRTSRSVSDAICILIDAGFRAVTGTTQSTAAGATTIDPSVDDSDAAPGRAVAAHLPAQMVEVIQYLAAEERRSVSFTVKALIREGLERRGLWRQAKAPLLSQPANAAPAIDVQPA